MKKKDEKEIVRGINIVKSNKRKKKKKEEGII